MSTKILTIIIPSYNMEKYLPKCLGSLAVAPELMERLEVLVVNDGSKDRTSEIAHEFATKHPNTFRVIDKTNGHYGSCINAALRAAVGRYVKILDADDSFDSDEISKFLKLIERTDADAIFTDYVTVDEQGRILARNIMPLVQNQPIVKDCLDQLDMVAMHALTYRTDLLREIGYRQTEGVAYTDTEWAAVPLSYARTMIYFPVAVYRYLVGREGQSVDRAVVTRNVGQMEKVAREMLARVSRIKKTTHCEGAAFYERSVRRLCQLVYDVYLLNAPISTCDLALADFDELVREVEPESHEQILKSRIPSTCGVKYISIWLNYPCFRHMVLYVVRGYLVVRRSFRKRG